MEKELNKMWIADNETTKDFTLEEIEKSICPTANKLIKDKSYVYCDIVDDALDPVRCEFEGYSTVTVKTGDYTEINFTLNNLITLIRNMSLADEYIDNTFFDLDGNEITEEEFNNL